MVAATTVLIGGNLHASTAAGTLGISDGERPAQTLISG